MKLQVSYLILILSLMGCGKESENLQYDGDVDVNFSVSGIVDVENINDDLQFSNSELKALTSKNLKSSNISEINNEVILEKKEYEGEDFDAIVSLVERDQPLKQLSNKIKVGATSNMGPNIRYRVFIYRKSNSQFVGEINGISGTSNTSSAQNTPFKISRNTEYTIVAFSWNNTTEPTIAGSPTNNPTIATSSTNQELLYTKFDITTNGNFTFHIPIIFKRQRASFQVEIDSKGIFAPIRTIGASTIPASYSQYASLNLVSGVYSSYTNINAGTTMPLTFNPAPTTSAPLYSVVANQYFTYNTTTINGFTVDMGAIQLLLDNSNNTTTRDYAAKQYTITTPITFERGKIKRVRIQLVATAKTLTNTTPRIRWAKTNLYYNPSATEAQGGAV